MSRGNARGQVGHVPRMEWLMVVVKFVDGIRWWGVGCARSPIELGMTPSTALGVSRLPRFARKDK